MVLKRLMEDLMISGWMSFAIRASKTLSNGMIGLVGRK